MEVRDMWENLFPRSAAASEGRDHLDAARVPIVRSSPSAPTAAWSSAAARRSTTSRPRTRGRGRARCPLAGTRKERQELYGELLDDVAGALWSAKTIEGSRAVLID